MPPVAHLRLLAALWLHEPDAAQVQSLHDAARSLGVALAWDGPPGELAPAYADLLLLNVPPYGTAYTDPWAEINTPAAQHVARRFEERGYRPAELREVGAPDHLGLCLGFLAHLHETRREEAPAFAAELLPWAPVCCLALERDPGAHPFYSAIAALTREALFASVDGASVPRIPPPRHDGMAGPGGEVRLRDVMRYLLAPARCGLHLSRARLGACALALGTRLPFGSRHDVAEWLFTAAGEGGRVGALLELLDGEAAAWQSAYERWRASVPAWQPYAGPWLERTAQARRMLAAMAQQAREGVPVEFLNEADADYRAGGSWLDDAS